jgi:hypothetical protein
MKKAYIYPRTQKKKEVTNPYLSDFVNSLSPYYDFLNLNKPTKYGIYDLIKYVGKIDTIFLNWIEDLPDKKGGYMQSLLFMMLFVMMKLRKVKIVYVLHNKESHYSSHMLLKKRLRKLLLDHSDYIICHASDGLKIDKNLKHNIKYLPHPFKDINTENVEVEKKYDILIWGSIREYKGIDTYLNYLESNNLKDKYKTLIIGKIHPVEYEAELVKHRSENILIENKFVDDKTLNNLIHQSRIILFTYNEKSVLSSGALVYSLSQGALVIGPKAGAFQDLKAEGIVDTFEDYDDLIKKLDHYLKNPNTFTDKIKAFAQANNWKNFGVKIAEWIK